MRVEPQRHRCSAEEPLHQRGGGPLRSAAGELESLVTDLLKPRHALASRLYAQGDCRLVAPRGVADRVLLGLLPSSQGGWETAVAALGEKGASCVRLLSISFLSH